MRNRCGQSNDHRRIHRQPSDGQAHTGARYHLVLPVRVRGRHAGCGRYRALPAGHVRGDEWQTADHADGGGDVPGALLREQG
jgi:hypothetical protein